ncbi:MAG: amino-acid N-acetyltransferase [Piscirickettsiaceae bacterium]|nr:amino-acid N-acetyltransferase [Piscirickettsiaceae bacterium]
MDILNHNNIAETTSWFRTAAPYISKHRDAHFVIAFDSETILTNSFDSLIYDIALLNNLGIKLVIIFGARKQIDAQSRSHNVEINYHDGLRITHKRSLDIVRSVIGQLRLNIETKFSFGLPHTPMADAQVRCTSGNLVIARPVGIRDGIDFGYTGEVRRIDIRGIHEQLDLGNVVLLPPIGFSPTGEFFNLSYEAIAARVATDLDADKLIFVGKKYDMLSREITIEQAENMKYICPILTAAMSACKAGVTRVHLLDRDQDGALIQELFSRDGAGTLIAADSFETTRKATIEDVGGIIRLIRPLEINCVLAKRSRNDIEKEIAHFTIMERDDTVIACAALYPYVKNEIGELSCLAVAKNYQCLGKGKELLSVIERQARSINLKVICILTTQTAHWFIERGFQEAKIADLPIERQNFYNYQRNSKIFTKKLY